MKITKSGQKSSGRKAERAEKKISKGDEEKIRVNGRKESDKKRGYGRIEKNRRAVE